MNAPAKPLHLAGRRSSAPSWTLRPAPRPCVLWRGVFVSYNLQPPFQRIRLELGNAVREIRALLAERGRPERAQEEKRYLKSDLDFLGVSVPDLRAVFRAWQKAHPDLNREALVQLLRELWKTSVHELRAFGIELLRARISLLTSADLDVVESLLRHSRSWAYVDTLAIHVAGPLVERDPRLLARLDRWIADPDFWVQRAALLALLPPLRRGERGEWARFVRYADSLLEEKEFFLRKTIGWVLREVAKKDPARVRRFLAEREGRVSGVTRREAERYL